VSHDFKTPLSTINAGLYLVSRQSDPQCRQQQVAMMKQQTQRLADLLEGMLTMTRLDNQSSLDLQPVKYLSVN
jgi:K+-sensing histidine kinase KdpD